MVDLHDHRMNGSTLDPLAKRGNEFMPVIEEMKSARLRFVAAIADSNEGFGWIWFANEKDLRAFLDLVVRYDSSPGSIYSRLVEPWHRPETLPAWSIEAKAEDVSDCYLTDDGRQEYPDERAKFQLSYTLKIPLCDWQAVLERLQKRNPNRKVTITHYVPSRVR